MAGPTRDPCDDAGAMARVDGVAREARRRHVRRGWPRRDDRRRRETHRAGRASHPVRHARRMREAHMTALRVGIVGWATAVPEGRVTNVDLEARVDTSDEWIVERTGIRERRVASANETTASLGTAAAAEALKRAGCAPADIDLMIVATASPEQPLPHTGAFIGDALGLRCASFDLQAACAGFVYELVVAASMMQTGYERVLIVGSETLSRIIDPLDRMTTVLFGDGAGAAVLGRTEHEPGLLAWDLGCDGSAAGLLEIPAGGSRRPAT